MDFNRFTHTIVPMMGPARARPEAWSETMQTIAHVSRDIIHGLLWFIETGWDFWAALFRFVPYGDPYVAAIAMGFLFVVIDRVVRPRTPTY